MTSNIFKSNTAALSLIAALSLASCTENDDMQIASVGSHGEETADFSLAVKGMPAAKAAAPGIEEQDAISVFQFGEEGLFSKSVISRYDPEGIGLVKGTTRALYCVSGIEIDATDKTSEAEFSLTTYATEEGVASAPLFLSGSTQIEASQMACELTMKRGVARIDLDARDADMEISAIMVEDAPAATYVFPQSAPLAAETTSYVREYAVAPAGVEKGAFMLFESDRAVHVTVSGSVDGKAVTVPAVIENVERNKVYTLRVYDKNANVKAGFTVADWEDGDTLLSNGDLANGLHIDAAASLFPAGVKVDYANNIIEVPASGAQGMKIAFKSEMLIDIDTICYAGARVITDSIEAKHVRFTQEDAYNTDMGVITKFDVSINPQMKGRPDYEIKMYVKKMVMATSYDCVTIRVAESPYQLQTVEIGGMTWMAFNAVSQDLGEQLFPEPGMTVEEAYQQNWSGYTGNFYQYGRLKGYSPWTKNDPNGNEATERNIPWSDPECVPLPPGYHVATNAEWLQLLPSGTTIPSTYKAGNGESIKVEIVELPGTLDDSPSASANKAKLLKRYIRFESLESGNVLILPVCALKGASMDEYPGGGRKMHAWASYWIAEDRYTWLFQISDANGALTATQARDRWNYNGFMPVRGVKD